MDWLMCMWACWVCVSGRFHDDPETGLVFRLGLIYNALGFYILVRVWCTSLDDAVTVCRVTSLVLLPVFAVLGLIGRWWLGRELKKAAGQASRSKAVIEGSYEVVETETPVGHGWGPRQNSRRS